MAIFSKIYNSFRGIRLNKYSPVSGKSLDYLLVGSMYAEQQSAYLNSYETGMSKSDIKKIVQEYWDIYNRRDAMAVLQDLLIRNEDPNVDIVFNAFENRRNYVEILKADLPDEKHIFHSYINLYTKLNNIIPLLIDKKLITDFSQIRRTKDYAWNYGRGAFLARCCFELEYLSEVELKKYLEMSYKELKVSCITWKEYMGSYIYGRAVCSGSFNDGMMQIADDLLNHDRSPLKYKVFL